MLGNKVGSSRGGLKKQITLSRVLGLFNLNSIIIKKNYFRKYRPWLLLNQKLAYPNSRLYLEQNKKKKNNLNQESLNSRKKLKFTTRKQENILVILVVYCIIISIIINNNNQ